MTVQELIDELMKVDDKNKLCLCNSSEYNIDTQRIIGVDEHEVFVVIWIDYCKSHSKEERDSTIGLCVSFDRNDRMHVIFKKLEKVGEPYRRWLSPSNNIMVQRYRLYGRNVIMPDEPYMYFNAIDNTIEIEIKQNKEDMEDLDKIKVRDYTKVEELNVMEEKKLNLKPFDIQKAREGKPVCTRDGRKARIICFDRKGYNMFPIVALIMNGDRESDIYTYRPNGTWDNSGNESDKDLMMLPEKKEGWINIIKTEGGDYCCKGEVNSNYNDAFIENINVLDNRGITVKIEWEE